MWWRMSTHRPLALTGLTSYRYRGPFGFIMIGARDHAEALREANRSLTLAKWEPAVIENLEVWNGATYVTARDAHA